MSHVLLMTLNIIVLSLFFGALLKNNWRQALIFSLKMFLVIIVISLALSWIMHIFS